MVNGGCSSDNQHFKLKAVNQAFLFYVLVEKRNALEFQPDGSNVYLRHFFAKRFARRRSLMYNSYRFKDALDEFLDNYLEKVIVR